MSTKTLPFSDLTYHTEPATKAEIISLVATYYNADPKRRGIKYSAVNPLTQTGCVYQNEKGNRCAVGLFLTDPTTLGEAEAGSGIADWAMFEIDTLLLPPYRGHDQEFWVDLQNFHDHAQNFDHKGLSSEGKEALETLYSVWI